MKTLTPLLNGRTRRKVANNTYVETREGGSVALRLHATDILTESANGSLVCNSGGWRTSTTKDRLNRFLPSGFRIYQERGQWKWSTGALYSDGDKINSRGQLVTLAKPGAEKAAAKERKEVNKFAAKCAAAVPLPEPGAGDCFFCAMRVQAPSEHAGKTLGDATSSDHIREHIREGYCVPSLVYSALQEAGCGPLIVSGAFGKAGDYGNQIARDYTKRAVRRYVCRRLGMAA